MQKVILASGSPRRRELLATIGIACEVIKSDAPEVITRDAPGEIVTELSYQKAKAVADALPAAADEERFVIGADTIVVYDHAILGKPKDAQDARRMLQLLSGHAHSVFTGVTILHEGQAHSFFKETLVHVMEMSAEEIDWYIATNDPFDKAGSYGIQGPFACFVEGIEGDYQNVVGLPVNALYRQLRAIGWKRT